MGRDDTSKILWQHAKTNDGDEVKGKEKYPCDDEETGSSTANDISDGSEFDDVILVEILPTEHENEQRHCNDERRHGRQQFNTEDDARCGGGSNCCFCFRLRCVCIIANIVAVVAPVLEVLILYGYYTYMIEIKNNKESSDDDINNEIDIDTEYYIKFELPEGKRAIINICLSWLIAIIVSIISIIGIQRSKYNVVVFACCNYISKVVVTFFLGNYLATLINAFIAYPHMLLVGDMWKHHRVAVSNTAINNNHH